MHTQPVDFLGDARAGIGLRRVGVRRVATFTAAIALLCGLAATAPGSAKAADAESANPFASLDEALVPPPPAATAVPGTRVHAPVTYDDPVVARAMAARAAESDRFKDGKPIISHLVGNTPTPDASSNWAPGYRRWTDGSWWNDQRKPLDPTPSLAIYLTNECILAGIGATAIALMLPTPAGPVAAAALGGVQDMSLLSIGALGCASGAAAGAASAGMLFAWEEPDTITDFAVAQVNNVQHAVLTTAHAVGGAWNRSDEIIQAAADGAKWAADGVVGGVASGVEYAMATVTGTTKATADAAGVMVASAADAIGGWWSGRSGGEAPVVAFDVAGIPDRYGDNRGGLVY